MAPSAADTPRNRAASEALQRGITMKRTLAGVIVVLCLAGCGGKADVQLVNNTSRYVEGNVEDAKFGLNAGGSVMRTVEWDGFLKSSIDASITYRVHATFDGGS